MIAKSFRLVFQVFVYDSTILFPVLVLVDFQMTEKSLKLALILISMAIRIYFQMDINRSGA